MPNIALRSSWKHSNQAKILCSPLNNDLLVKFWLGEWIIQGQRALIWTINSNNTKNNWRLSTIESSNNFILLIPKYNCRYSHVSVYICHVKIALAILICVIHEILWNIMARRHGTRPMVHSSITRARNTNRFWLLFHDNSSFYVPTQYCNMQISQ